MASEAGTSINAEDYLAAARDHAVTLPELYAAGKYVLTIYVAGLAVECMFRAYAARDGRPFRSDHSLKNHDDDARYSVRLTEAQYREANPALLRLIELWRNTHRYRSPRSMRRFLKASRLDRGIRGDFLKENARRAVVLADRLLTLGFERWPAPPPESPSAR